MIEFGLSLMPEADFAIAALALFDEDLFDVVEWSFDMGWGNAGLPDWLAALCQDYGSTGGLLGHGVSFSLLAGGWTAHHQGWLDRLEREVQTRHYRHVSEHIGFVGAGRFSFAAPLPMPYHRRVVELGQRRVKQISAAAGCRVGLENLATSLGGDDARDQGALVADLLEPVDGFVVLDLHNLWCQSHNLGIDIDALLANYPLDRVAEVHVSGGSWDSERARPIRRDTHDDLVPEAVVELLATVVPRLANLESVIYERLGTSLTDHSHHDAFRDDVRRLAAIVSAL